MRTLIYGSCVARDTFEFLPQNYELVRYIARQSLISAYSPPAESYAIPRLDSPFQHRMLEGDRTSNLPAMLENHRDVDLLLFDITDERLGVYALPDGSFITRTVELIRSGHEDSLPAGTRLLEWGSGEHLELWTGALSRFAADVSRLGLIHKLRPLSIPWASRTTAGQPTPASFGLTARQGNRWNRAYLARVAERTGVRLLRPSPWRPVRSSEQHRWGPAPFHYTDVIYQDVAEKIVADSR